MPGSAAEQGSSRPSRKLLVLLGTLPVEDGQTPPPALGDVVRLTLRFAEADSDWTDAAVSPISARAEPLGDGSPRGSGMRWDGTVDDRPPVWPTVLHGDGWSATWSAPRPVIGQVVLRGMLIHDLDIGIRTSVRGRVLRARVVTETIDNTDPDQTRWRPIPSAQRLRDVEVSPRWFDHGLVAPDDAPSSGWVVPVPADPYVVERGVLLDLDLDDLPALAPRPRIVPGAVAAHGQDMWVADTRLPLVLRVRRPLDEHPKVTEYPWAGRILDPGHGERRSVHADDDGAWITGPDGVHRIDPNDLDRSNNGREDDGRGGTVRLVDDAPAWLLATTNRGALLTTVHLEPGDPHTPLALRLTTPGGHRSDIALDDRSVAAATADGSGFVLLLRHRDHPPGPDSPGGQADRRPWLGRLTATGDLADGPSLDEGPYLEVGHPSRLQLVPGDPALVLDQDGSGLRRVSQDLTLAEGVALWAVVLRAYAAGGRLWVATHPPHPEDIRRRGSVACWPLPGPPDYPDDRQYWLLTELDPTTLIPQVSTLVPHIPDDLAVDAAGTVWIAADGVRHLPASNGAAAELLDVAELLNAHTTPAATNADAAVVDPDTAPSDRGVQARRPGAT